MQHALSNEFFRLLTAASICWLAVGAFALTLTPLPAHTAALGWTPAFSLLLAPLCALAGIACRWRPR